MARLACMFCGEHERVSVFEVWDDGAFQLDTCCEGMRDSASEFMAEDPRAAAQWLAQLPHDDDDEGAPTFAELVGKPRRVLDATGQLLLDWNPEIVPVPWREAREFVRAHHRHCKPPAGWRFGAGIRNGRKLIGVVIVGRPVARAIDASSVVEVNRLCIRTDIADGLAWNACSMLYGWAAREAKARGFQRVITYTLDSEAGTTLKAAGWTPEAVTRGGSWDRPSRARTDAAPTVKKTRWARELRTSPKPPTRTA